MARIRTIKPEFWTSEQVADCSPTARLMFIGIWNFCDDGGVHPDSAKRIKMEVFPADLMEIEVVEKLLEELVEAGLVKRFSTEGKAYIHVTGWHHQKIEKPSIKYPQPNFVDDKPSTLKPVAEDSPTSRRMVGDHQPPEGKGRESKGKGKEEATCSEVAAPPSEPETVAEPSLKKQTPTRPTSDPKTPAEVPLVILPCVGNGQKTWGFMPSMLPDFQEAYPALDIVAELKKAALWLKSNPKKRKTRKGMLSFLAYWMGRAQNQGGQVPAAQKEPAKVWEPT